MQVKVPYGNLNSIASGVLRFANLLNHHFVVAVNLGKILVKSEGNQTVLPLASAERM